MNLSQDQIKYYKSLGLKNVDLLEQIIEKCQTKNEHELLDLGEHVLNHIWKQDPKLRAQYSYVQLLDVIATLSAAKEVIIPCKYETPPAFSNSSDEVFSPTNWRRKPQNPIVGSFYQKNVWIETRQPCPMFHGKDNRHTFNCICGNQFEGFFNLDIEVTKSFSDLVEKIMSFVFKNAKYAILPKRFIKSSHSFNPIIASVPTSHNLHKDNYNYLPLMQRKENNEIEAYHFTESDKIFYEYKLGNHLYSTEKPNEKLMMDWFGYFPIPNSDACIGWIMGKKGRQVDCIRNSCHLSKLIIPLQKFRTKNWVNIAIYASELKYIIAAFSIIMWFINNARKSNEFKDDYEQIEKKINEIAEESFKLYK